MSVMLNFAMFPMDKPGSLSRHVAASLATVEASGLDYRFGPMGTSIEADDLDAALDVVKRCFQQMKTDSRRIYCTVTIDYRQGDDGRLATKVEHVEKVVGHELKK